MEGAGTAERLRGPIRTCVGCAERFGAQGDDLSIRFVISPVGDLAVDASGGGFGRGAHVHARPGCVDGLLRGLGRAFKGKARSIDAEPLSSAALGVAIAQAYERRATSLIASAARGRKLAVGADAVTEACAEGEAAVVVVAKDAAAAAELGAVRRAVSEGRAVAFADKAALASLVGKTRTRGDGAANEVGVLAVLDRALGASLADAVRVAELGAEAAGRTATGPRAAPKGQPRQRAAPGRPRDSFSKHQSSGPRGFEEPESVRSNQDPRGPGAPRSKQQGPGARPRREPQSTRQDLLPRGSGSAVGRHEGGDGANRPAPSASGDRAKQAERAEDPSERERSA